MHILTKTTWLPVSLDQAWEFFCSPDNLALITPKDMNLMYNMADVTVGISSNEGFGLSTAESLMAGTPIIVNVTGGL